MSEPGPNHLRRAAATCRAALAPHADADWSRNAGDLEWSCRDTIDHICNTMIFYGSHLAMESTERLPRIRNGMESATVPDLLVSLETTAAMLARIVEASPATARGFHPAGLADPSGFAAMGCNETLIHSSDIGKGLGAFLQPPEHLCRDVLDRLFPWAPKGFGGWETLLWANGRSSLPGFDRQDENWYFHCAPLSEWDGTIARRRPR